MAEGEGLEPSRPKPPVFKTGALPIMLTLLEGMELSFIVPPFNPPFPPMAALQPRHMGKFRSQLLSFFTSFGKSGIL
jgi:hypothetical protein